MNTQHSLPLAVALARCAVALVAALAAIPRTSLGGVPEEPTVTPQSSFALLELFTSEGCSSCPPADALLREVEARSSTDRAQVFVLAYHVDYWNSLGWRDRLSDGAYSGRQREYAARLGTGRVYTPQLVVNGMTEFVGSDRSRVDRELKSALATPAGRSIRFAVAAEGESGVEATFDPASVDAAADLFFALTEQGLSSEVKKGENAGRSLRHPSVVRLLHRATPDERGQGRVALRLPTEIQRSAARIVAFVQDPKSGAVVAVSAEALPVAP